MFCFIRNKRNKSQKNEKSLTTHYINKECNFGKPMFTRMWNESMNLGSYYRVQSSAIKWN